MEQYGFNLRNTERFYIDTIEKSGFTIFASREIMQMIDDAIPPENRKYMLDGTFDVAPIGSFYQLLIIAIDYKKDVSLWFEENLGLRYTCCYAFLLLSCFPYSLC